MMVMMRMGHSPCFLLPPDSHMQPLDGESSGAGFQGIGHDKATHQMDDGLHQRSKCIMGLSKSGGWDGVRPKIWAKTDKQLRI